MKNRQENGTFAPDAGLALCIALAVFAGMLLADFWRTNPDFAEFIGYLIGGGLLLLQIYAFNRRATAAEETAKAMQRTAAAAQKTAELNERGNIAERFKNAIEHLGDKSASVRLGGIYALHHIAHEVEEYRERVFKILCAHIRETTTQDSYGQTNGKCRPNPTIEIQSILDLLFIKSPDCNIYNEFIPILENANLQGARVVQANLSCAILVGAKLENADFDSANLHQAFFDMTDVQGANFYAANLRSTTWRGAKNLEFQQFRSAKTLYNAGLPQTLANELKHHHPELFNKPGNR